MDMETWAELEIDAACRRELDLSSNNPADAEYGAACYRSALKAFKSLMEDMHSGASIQITKRILDRLIDWKPLTPILGEDAEWVDASYNYMPKGVVERYQNIRMPSLFKYVHEDETVSYYDVDRVSAYEIDEDDRIDTSPFSSSFITKLIDEMFPISMPYLPQQYVVHVKTFLYDKRNGDFDTRCVVRVINKENGEEIPINRYFKDDSLGFIEISKEEYDVRYEHRCK